MNVHELYEVGHVSIQDRGSSVCFIAAIVNFLHPKYQCLQVVRSIRSLRKSGLVAEQGHEAMLTTTASAVLPVPPQGIQIAQQPWIQQSYFLRQRPLQEWHLICLSSMVWAASPADWHLGHFSERKTWGLLSSWSLPPKEWKFAPLGAKGDLPSSVLWILLQSSAWVYFHIAFRSFRNVRNQCEILYSAWKKPSPFAMQSEKIWFHVNPKIFFPLFFKHCQHSFPPNRTSHSSSSSKYC